MIFTKISKLPHAKNNGEMFGTEVYNSEKSEGIPEI